MRKEFIVRFVMLARARLPFGKAIFNGSWPQIGLTRDGAVRDQHWLRRPAQPNPGQKHRRKRVIATSRATPTFARPKSQCPKSLLIRRTAFITSATTRGARPRECSARQNDLPFFPSGHRRSRAAYAARRLESVRRVGEAFARRGTLIDLRERSSAIARGAAGTRRLRFSSTVTA